MVRSLHRVRAGFRSERYERPFILLWVATWYLGIGASAIGGRPQMQYQKPQISRQLDLEGELGSMTKPPRGSGDWE